MWLLLVDAGCCVLEGCGVILLFQTPESPCIVIVSVEGFLFLFVSKPVGFRIEMSCLSRL